MIVFPDPIGGEVPNLIEMAPKVLRQPFISDRPIESLDIGILLRLTVLDVLELNPGLLRPAGDRPTDIFRSLTTSNRVRIPAPGDDLSQSPDDSFRGQREVNLDAQSLAVEINDHVEQPKASAVL